MTRPLSQDYESSFQRTADAIVSMAARLRRAGIPLVLVYIPDRLRSMLYKPHDDFPGLEPDSLRDRLAALAAHAGLTFVDPTPNFRQDPDAPSLFYPADGHMTAGGQALVATATYQALRADRRLESLVECSGFTAASAVR